MTREVPEVPVRHCPRCGFKTEGAARFCPACAFDFWAAAASQAPATTAAPIARSSVGSAWRPPGAAQVAEGPATAAGPSGASIAVLVGGLIIIAGSWLPWVSTALAPFDARYSGLAGGGDGWTTLLAGFGIVLLALINLKRANEFNRLGVWLLGGMALLVFWINLDRVLKAVDGFDAGARGIGSATVGIGLWVVALGAIVAVAFNIGRPAGNGPSLRALFRRT